MVSLGDFKSKGLWARDVKASAEHVGFAREVETCRCALSAIGEAAVPAAAETLRMGEEPRVRLVAAQVLASLASFSREAWLALQGAREDRDPEVRDAARKALQAIGESRKRRPAGPPGG